MLATGRFLFVAIAALAVCTAANAQLPIAPRPHPTIDELARDYQRLGLPLPPPEAELVRIEQGGWRYNDNDQQPRITVWYQLGFKVPSTQAGKDPRYLVGDRAMWHWWINPSTTRTVNPTRDALNDVRMRNEFLLCLAAQCKLRGWHEFAKEVYDFARKNEIRLQIESQLADEEWDIESVFPSSAWYLQARRLDEPGSDRKEILAGLKLLLARDPGLRTPVVDDLLRRLELTVTTPQSRPGSIEALIDDLTEYWENPYSDQERFEGNPAWKRGQDAYFKLIELGFDAVPALIDHVRDDRVTRATSEGFNNFWPFNLTVGHLCSRILFALSARKIGGGYWAMRGDRIDADNARKWFAEARKTGEEKWLLDNLHARKDVLQHTNEGGPYEQVLLRVIGAKYPRRLAEIYRASWGKTESHPGNYLEAVLTSRMTRDEKIALLREGLAQKEFGDRVDALKGLAELDKPLFQKHLHKTLEEIQALARKQPNECPALGWLVPLILKANDRACWDLFGAAVRFTIPDERMSIIRELDPRAVPDEPDPHRKERLRILLGFLDDASTDPDDERHIQVRDYAAYHLAGLYRFSVERDGEYYSVYYPGYGGPLTRLLLREAVRKLATRELMAEAKK